MVILRSQFSMKKVYLPTEALRGQRAAHGETRRIAEWFARGHRWAARGTIANKYRPWGSKRRERSHAAILMAFLLPSLSM